MKIGIVGTQNSGKSTVIKNFLKKWPMYELASPTYRDLIDKNELKLNQIGTKESQEAIRNALVEQALQNKEKTHCIHDRCVLDNLIYTLWLADKGKISDEQFITSSFNITREVLKLYDVIFLLVLDEKNPIPLEESKHRDNDPLYQKEINNLFLAAFESYNNHEGLIFPVEDCPGFIVITGDEIKEEKTRQIAEYIGSDGNLIEPGGLSDEIENEFKILQNQIQEKLEAKRRKKSKHK